MTKRSIPLTLVFVIEWPWYIPSRSTLVPAAITVLCCLLLTGAAYGVVQHWREKEADVRFNLVVDNDVAAAQREIEANFGALRMLRGFIESNPAISLEAFAKFSQRALDTYPTVRALEWLPHLRDRERPAFEKQLSAETGHPTCITQGKPGVQSACSPVHSDYLAVQMIYPQDQQSRKALGFDVLSSRGTEATVRKAILTGEVVSTGRLRLLEKTTEQFGITTFLPVYYSDPEGKPAIAQTEQWRLQHTRGLVMCIFQIGDVLGMGIERLGRDPVDFFFFDLTGREGNRYLYTHYGSARPRADHPASGRDVTGTLITSKAFDVAGRKWQVIARADPVFMGTNESLLSGFVLAGGFVFTVCMGLYVVSYARHSKVLALANRELRTEIRERKKAEQELVHIAYHDPLTGLANRSLFAASFQDAIAKAALDESGTALLGFLYLDLDGFKLINDTLGHGVGDSVLKIVSDRLRSCVGPDDVIARTGGDEFNVLLRSPADVAEAERTARRILAALEVPVQLGDSHPLSVSASAGLSFYPTDGQDYEQLSSTADMAMYYSKIRGKNQVQRFGLETSTIPPQSRGLVVDLRNALADGELCLYYQPLISLTSHANIRFEALIRWNHPEHGVLMPSQFLGLAEETGLTIAIGEWVLREAMRQAKEWQLLAIDSGVGVSINVSAQQFSRPDFIATVHRALTDSDLNPSLLEIELTESTLIPNFEDARRKIEALRLRGIAIALDDFGTGYAALSYLPNLPIDALKIDRSFVVELEHHSSAVALLDSLISLAKKQKMRVVVEGIETVRQMTIVKAMKADELQGFLLGRPMPQPAVKRFLETWLRDSSLRATQMHGKTEPLLNEKEAVAV